VVVAVDLLTYVFQHQFHILDGRDYPVDQVVVQVDIFHLHNQEL
jgi:hypothetical protein